MSERKGTTAEIISQIELLQAQKKEIAKTIRTLKQRLKNRKYYKKYFVKKQTLVNTLYNKKVKDLTPEQLKEYNRIRATKTRKKRAK